MTFSATKIVDHCGFAGFAASKAALESSGAALAGAVEAGKNNHERGFDGSLTRFNYNAVSEGWPTEWQLP